VVAIRRITSTVVTTIRIVIVAVGSSSMETITVVIVTAAAQVVNLMSTSIMMACGRKRRCRRTSNRHSICDDCVCGGCGNDGDGHCHISCTAVKR